MGMDDKADYRLVALEAQESQSKAKGLESFRM